MHERPDAGVLGCLDEQPGPVDVDVLERFPAPRDSDLGREVDEGVLALACCCDRLALDDRAENLARGQTRRVALERRDLVAAG